MAPFQMATSTVAILLNTKGSSTVGNDKNQKGAVNVVLWAHTTSNPSLPADQQLQSLTYFHYWDHSHLFQHTDALLQRLPGVQAVHVASTAGSSSANNKQQGDGGATERLLRFLDESLKHASKVNDEFGIDEDTDEDESENANYYAAPAPEQVVQFHKEYTAPTSSGQGSDTTSRLQTAMQQLLNNSTASIKFAGDVQYQQHPEIAAALIFYLYCTGNWPKTNSEGSVQWIGAGRLHSCLTLDSTAADAIHLWPPATAGEQLVTGGATHNNSLYGLLASSCQTASGKWLLKQWLRQPSVCLKEIVERQDAVERLVKESVGRDAIRQEGLHLFAGSGSSGDLSKLAATLVSYRDREEHRLMGCKNTRRALAALYQLYLVGSQKIPLLTEQVQMALGGEEEALNEQGSLLDKILQTLQQVSTALTGSVKMMEAVLDLEQAPREFLIQAKYETELQDIAQDLDRVQAQLEECHTNISKLWAEASGSGNSQAVRLEEVNGGWQFRLPNTNDSKILQKQLAAIVQIERIVKNGVYFTTKELRQLSTENKRLRGEYDNYQAAVVSHAVSVASTYVPVLLRASEAVSRLDVLTALAHTAVWSEQAYCRPTMTDSNGEEGTGIELKAARHPCVELQEGIDFIPNDYDLKYGESSFLLVTGPNMGGKSTYIRALGAIVTLAQIGSFVPCSAATINICHHILTRVGAGDLQDRGISTFMAEMLESSSILRTATKRSLIIVDELGRGTSTCDGYGLARGISEYIVQKIGCMTLFATHFHELTFLEDQEKSVKNCHVTAQKGVEGLAFLYAVKPGPCLESFGIQVAEMANVPTSVIQEAKRRARKREDFQFRKQARTEDESLQDKNGAEPASSDPGAAEEAAAALAWIERFRRLPKEVFRKEYETAEQKREALLQMLEG